MNKDRKWLFYFEDDLNNEYSFIIEADNQHEAYDNAEESYGPQVMDMMYKEIKFDNQCSTQH